MTFLSMMMYLEDQYSKSWSVQDIFPTCHLRVIDHVPRYAINSAIYLSLISEYASKTSKMVSDLQAVV